MDGEATSRSTTVAADDRALVLHVRVLADRGGGPEKTITAAPQHLHGSGYRPLAAYLHPPGLPQLDELATAAALAGGELIGFADRGPLDPRPVLALSRLCRRRDVAIWHAHDYKSAAIGVLLRRWHPMRMVTTLHGWSDLDARTRLYFAIERLCLPAFDHVFAVSPDLLEAALRSGVESNRVSMLGNAVDVDRFCRGGPAAAASLRRELAVPANRLVVASVCRLMPSKGLDVALDAFARLVAGGIDAELWIAGDGPDRDLLESRAATLPGGARVRFLGYRVDVRPVLEASDLYLLSSWREGTPNAVLEAMAMELPVVATAVGGVAELVRDGATGRLCAAGDAEALATVMRELSDAAELRMRLGSAGRDLVRARHSLRERASHECRVYDRLTGAGAS